MRTKLIVSAMAMSMGLAATPAFAQTVEEGSFSGVYVGGSIGMTVQGNDGGSSILFDNNLDGTFGDTVNTSGGVDAFSTGFCNGAATSSGRATGCTKDKDDIEYYGNIGFDKQMGSFVVGVVGEFGKTGIRDSVTAFSTTPASYTMTRKLKYNGGLRLRAGYTPNNSTLFYVTGGGAYGKVKNSFTTTNGANSFTDNGNADAWGYSAGGGVEQRVFKNFSVGLQYLYTDLKDKDYRVGVGPGTAAATNPFLLVNPAGTDFRRSDDNFRFHSIRATAAFRF